MMYTVRADNLGRVPLFTHIYHRNRAINNVILNEAFTADLK